MTFDDVRWWLADNWPGLVVGAIFVLGLVLLVMGGIYDARAKAEFMAECEMYRPQFECTAMWRAGEPDVVPVPIIIPSGR